jgi:hypothetical protein
MDRVLMRVMILKEDVEYSRFKTKPFQLLMVTDDTDLKHDEQQTQQQTHQQQQLQQHQTTAAAAAAAAAVLRQSSNAAALSSSASGGLSASAMATPPPGPAAAGDSSSSGSRSAAAAAAAAAARVSAAASALAAHMTNPQQLWNEKRGSGSGLRSRRHSEHRAVEVCLHCCQLLAVNRARHHSFHVIHCMTSVSSWRLSLALPQAHPMVRLWVT